MADRAKDRMAALGLAGAGVVLIVVGLSASRPVPRQGPVDLPRGPQVPRAGAAAPRPWGRGIVRPAADSGLTDAEPILGVAVGGKARAYLVQALGLVSRHVVNDVLGGRAVTVTYCDRTECSRMLTGPGDEPLDVAVGGYADGLVLAIDGFYYRQDDLSAVSDGPAPDCPLTDLSFKATTWGAWRRAYPDTDVYVGSD